MKPVNVNFFFSGLTSWGKAISSSNDQIYAKYLFIKDPWTRTCETLQLCIVSILWSE